MYVLDTLKAYHFQNQPLQFEREHSPLLKDLLTYLKELLNDYKNEVDGMRGWTCVMWDEGVDLWVVIWDECRWAYMMVVGVTCEYIFSIVPKVGITIS